jgi:hypothetical protein
VAVIGPTYRWPLSCGASRLAGMQLTYRYQCGSALEGKGAAMSLLPTPVFDTSVWLPTGELDENRAIDCIADLLPG